ncbi:ChaN family lipoprotein [Sphingobacterium shayense]|uniref:ChaN family lipoprotein n=1 Tax=Sphingobacterium shayense TaxID=626343 RepID=UPI0015535188|nr:ChaN family lipoprotein [Sphingobacterium shayense]NQD69919.1 ChaN family lipoprotein [Sphingobacterium shayense]
MKQLVLGLLMITGLARVIAQQPYQILNRSGQQISWDSISVACEQHSYVFFGELHDQPQAHIAELELLKILKLKYSGRIILAMEMFEADVQPIIDEYFSGQINQNSFQTEARVWKNYFADYKPLVEFARENEIPLIASNVPRRYASSVYHNGLEVLSELSSYAKQFLPPLPMNIDTSISIYREMKSMGEGHKSTNLVYSQALKDATMAHFLTKHKTNDNIIIHLNGSYHSKNWQGIPSFLPEEARERVLTINTVLTSQDFDIQQADYTLIIDDSKQK